MFVLIEKLIKTNKRCIKLIQVVCRLNKNLTQTHLYCIVPVLLRELRKFFVLIGISRLLGADYWPTDNPPVPYLCISSSKYIC